MAPLSSYSAQYSEMISQLDPNATMDTPVSLQELHNAYSRLAGGHMRLKKLLAKMMASYPIDEIEAVWAARGGRRQIHDEIFDLLFTDEGRESALPPDRTVLYEFDAERRAKCAAAATRRHAQALAQARNIQINHAAATFNNANAAASTPGNGNNAAASASTSSNGNNATATSSTSNNGNNATAAVDDANALSSTSSNVDNVNNAKPTALTTFHACHNYYVAPAAARTTNNANYTAPSPTANPVLYLGNIQNILSHSDTTSMGLNAYYSPHGPILIVHYRTALEADRAACDHFRCSNLNLPGIPAVALTDDQSWVAWHITGLRNIVGLGNAPWVLAGVPPGISYVALF